MCNMWQTMGNKGSEDNNNGWLLHTANSLLVPSVSALLKKQLRLGHAGIVDHFVNLSIPDFKKV